MTVQDNLEAPQDPDHNTTQHSHQAKVKPSNLEKGARVL